MGLPVPALPTQSRASASDTCHLCNEKGHWARDCPRRKTVRDRIGDGGLSRQGRDRRDWGRSWRQIPPSARQPFSKVVNGNRFYWCNVCGRWSTTHGAGPEAPARHTGKSEDGSAHWGRSWRKIPPSAGQPFSKVVNGNRFYWCDVCAQWSTTHGSGPEAPARHTGKSGETGKWNDVRSHDNNQNRQRRLEEAETERRLGALEKREKASDAKERHLVWEERVALEQVTVAKQQHEAQLVDATNSRDQYRQLVEDLNDDDKAELSEKLDRKRKRMDSCQAQLLEARKLKAKADVLLQREREQKEGLEHRLEEQGRYYREEIKRMRREHRETIKQLIKTEEEQDEGPGQE